MDHHHRPDHHPLRDVEAVLATRHDKLPLIAPAMADVLGLRVRAVDVDTDSLGTFAGEVERAGSMWDTAIAKARLGMVHTGVPIGLASEGSIGLDPVLPFAIGDTELVVLVDDRLGIVVGESHTSWDVVAVGRDVGPGDSIDDLLAQADFPAHGLIVRPAAPTAVATPGPIVKGVHDRVALEAAIVRCRADSADGLVRIETDLRAHHCPSRRPVIHAAASRLATRLARTCPACAAPGWGVVRRRPGARCAACGAETTVARAEVEGCARCEHEHEHPLPGAAGVDPAHCPVCNP